MSSTITVRNVKIETKARLKQMAARQGHSMEEEVRRILNRAVSLASEEFELGTRLSQIGQQLDLTAVDPFELPSRLPRTKTPLDFNQPEYTLFDNPPDNV